MSFEESLKQCNNLSAIRSLGEKQPSLAGEVKDALEPMKDLLQGIFIRLSLKGNSFSTFIAASTIDIDEVMKHIVQVDCTVTKECTQKAYIIGEKGGIPGLPVKFVTTCSASRNVQESHVFVSLQDCLWISLSP